MWAHYADEHRGLVAGVAFFPGDYLPIFKKFIPRKLSHKYITQSGRPPIQWYT